MDPGSVCLFMVFVFPMDQPINKVQCGNDWDVKEGQWGSHWYWDNLDTRIGSL